MLAGRFFTKCTDFTSYAVSGRGSSESVEVMVQTTKAFATARDAGQGFFGGERCVAVPCGPGCSTNGFILIS